MDYAKYLDENGYPGTRQAEGSWDGGDTAAIIGTVQALAPNISGVLFPFDFPWNEAANAPLRHPDTYKWYGQPDRFSRDQLIPAMCAQLTTAYRALSVSKLYSSHKTKLFLTAWNTKGNGAMEMPEKFPDITGPEIWALWLRVLKPWWARLILPFLDIETLINSLLWRFSRKDNVCRNHMLVCLMIQKYSPTITGWLAYKILNWSDLLQRWQNHCEIVGEYPTHQLFREEYDYQQRNK